MLSVLLIVLGFFFLLSIFSLRFRIFVNRYIKKIYKFKNSDENLNQNNVSVPNEQTPLKTVSSSTNVSSSPSTSGPSASSPTPTSATSLPNIHNPSFDYNLYKQRQLYKHQVRNRLLDSFDLAELSSVHISPPKIEELPIQDNIVSSSDDLEKDIPQSFLSRTFFYFWNFFSFNNA